ncbi:MAG TPA: hypothetical protein VFO67_13145, partial [Gemmatimonadales bacterium]|nr:hypothetical protein [Gemmatimonadales bacterium]
NTSVRFLSISVGRAHSCGLGTDSIAYCWGANDANQVGSGPDTCPGVSYGGCARSPTPVPGASRFRALQTTGLGALADETTCGITRTDDLFCWGSNRYGQFGDGVTGSSSNPVTAAAPGLKLASLELGAQF